MFIKYTKHPSPPFTCNKLIYKMINKKVNGEGLKTLFYIYARQGKKSVFSFFWFSGFSKNPKKEYNIRFKIYPSPFTSLPQPSFHIFIIELPTFVFWGYPSEIFRYLSEIFSYPSEIFCYLSELCSYPSEIFFRMIPWFFRTLFPESTQIAQIA